MKNLIVVMTLLAGAFAQAEKSDTQVLWSAGDHGVKFYRIPALCTAPNGDLVAACDARVWHGGDLNTRQPINISIRRSSDNGKTWTAPENSWTWTYNDVEKWAGSDPSFIVDMEAKKIFLFYNVWESKGQDGIYQFWVQESSDNGKTWSRPRDISKDIAFAAWPFGKRQNQGAFIFITSGSGIQTKDGLLLHTLVNVVGDSNALFGSDDHGATWKAIGNPVKCGNECKVVELSDGSWMINSRWRNGGRQVHVSKDRGQTWESRFDPTLRDPGCNAQLLRVGKMLLFSNCNSGGRNNLYLRASTDEGLTWNTGISICPQGSAYSDITITKDQRVAILYEGAGYQTINFVTIPLNDIKESLEK